MLPSKPRSGLSDTSNHKATPATPKDSKLSRARSTKSDSSSPSPLQNPRFSPKSVESKPPTERKSPRTKSTTPDKQLRPSKGPELQGQPGKVQEDLTKAKEQLASVEQEKTRALDELKEAKKLADEANEKLKEALAAQKKAEESLGIEKFRADELELASIEACKMKDEEWRKQLEGIRNQHSLDVQAIPSMTEELEKVKHELQVSTEAKNAALSQVDDATKIAAVNAEKMKSLSVEVDRLKSMLDSKLESVNNDTAMVIRSLNSEVDALKRELERAKAAEGKLVEMEVLVERLRTELAALKSAELDSSTLVDELKKKTENLELQLVEANQSEKSLLDSLTMAMKQLDESNALLQDTETERIALKGKVESLEIEVVDAKSAELDSNKLADELKRKSELLEVQLTEANQSEKSSLMSLALVRNQVEDGNALLQDAEYEIAALKKKVEWLEAQLAEANESKKSSLESLSMVRKQLEESNSFLQDAESESAVLKGKIESLEIEVARYKEDLVASEQGLDVANRKAMEIGKEVEDLKSKIQTLEEEKLQALNSEKTTASDIESFSAEKRKLMKELEIAKDDAEKAKKAMEGLASALHEVSTEARETQERLLARRTETEDAHAQIEQLRSALNNTEENYEVMLDEARYEIVCLKKSIERLETESKDLKAEWEATELRLVSTLKTEGEHEVEVVKEGGDEVRVKLEQAESRVTSANEAVEVAKVETLQLKERLLDKENELQSINQENEDLRIREAASTKKANELSALLAEATTKKLEENGELSNSEKEYDLLPNSMEIPEENMNGSHAKKSKPEEEKANGYQCLGEEEPVKVDVKMWEGYKANEKEKDQSSEVENEGESIDDELDLKMGSGSFDQTNGLSSENAEDGAVSPTRQHPKKKKALLHKFGSLLKKKGNNKQ